MCFINGRHEGIISFIARQFMLVVILVTQVSAVGIHCLCKCNRKGDSNLWHLPEDHRESAGITGSPWNYRALSSAIFIESCALLLVLYITRDMQNICDNLVFLR